MKKQTAGREALGTFAPKFADLNDDVLFGEVWAREDKLSLRDRSVITVTALMTKGIFDNSLKYHIINAKNNGVTAEEMSEIITHLAFYVGWPNAWAAFNLAKEVYSENNWFTILITIWSGNMVRWYIDIWRKYKLMNLKK